MSTLRNLQQDFMAAVFSEEKAALAQHLDGTESDCVWRTDIYRNNVFSNLRGALESAYPVIVKLVGAEFFRYAAREYIYQYPSVSGDLHRFGGAFGTFLATFSPAAQLPYLPDVARLEWLCHRAYFAADHAPLRLDRLLQVAPERYGDLKFTLNPACALCESVFPVERIWQVNQEDYTGAQSIDLSSGPATALVQRDIYRVAVVTLPRSEWRGLHALSTGQTFSAACDAALQVDPNLDLAATLRRWVDEAILVDFAIST